MIGRIAAILLFAVFAATLFPSPGSVSSQVAGECPAHRMPTRTPAPHSHDCCNAGHETAILTNPPVRHRLTGALTISCDYEETTNRQDLAFRSSENDLAFKPPGANSLRI